ncbi:translation initiation factor IF-6 [Desulfurococcus mucosus]|uniref:Translation initiation factor 6 n=1 Tax=Desulfurococcus mucosus (strain ATCC 35584 / DSM 2162 / JCM 9187 / O7/1) TaxID=765177 RepID=E8RAB2_DESM0|nr:translation initiation factor IF-6 [Desulfurococcus mucosus]ADV65418.1 translation initiation factor 6 (aeIF-6) [Desulfurococcus mucosus DSM 2162]
MEITRMSFFGNSNIGVYAYVNGKVLILPPGISSHDVRELTEVLGVEAVVEARVAGTVLNGVFTAGNDNAIILPRVIFADELEYIKKQLDSRGIDIRLHVSGSRYTALGNLLSCNNKGCIASPLLEKEEVEELRGVLGVEILQTRLVNLDIPGSVLVVNDHGGVAHPDVSEDDLKTVEGVLRVRVERATVNAGVPFVKSGLLANNHGIVVGGSTTGPEILRIRRGFGGGE